MSFNFRNYSAEPIPVRTLSRNSALPLHARVSSHSQGSTARNLGALLAVLVTTGSLSAQSLADAPATQQLVAALDAREIARLKSEAEVVQLDRLVVAETRDRFAPVTGTDAAENLNQVAGAVKLVDSALAERGRVGTQADLLAFQPGVFAAPPAGSGDGIKLSIRGSAIARSAGNFFRSGSLFTFDGLPVTGAGGTPYELFETYGLNYTEVLLGGNAYDFGALQLGGAINYVTKTGYDASPFEARIDVGSFKYRKLQVSSGQVLGKADYFISAASLRVDGYQEHSKGKSLGFAGNFGYKVSPTISTRIFLRYRHTENEGPGSISLNQLKSDSSKANPTNITSDNFRTQPGSTWIASKTNFQITSDSRLEIGLVYHDAPIDISTKPSFGTVAVGSAAVGFVDVYSPTGDSERSLWTFRDVTVSAKYTRDDTLFDLPSTTTVAFTIDREFDADVNVFANNANVITGGRAFKTLIKTANYNDSEDSSARIINALSLTDRLTLNTGLGVAYIRRAGEVTYFSPAITAAAAAPGALGRTIDRDNTYFTPRLGLLFNATKNLTFFTNATRSIEGPNSWQLNRGSAGNYQYHDNIRDQQAIAYELGSRATVGAFTGTAALFYTDVKDELLTVPINPANLNAGSYTFNGGPTYKQGIELSLDTVLWNDSGFLVAAPAGKSSKLSFGQSLSLNDFGYKGDVNFGKNELPGVPRQYYQARVQYDDASGFYGSVSVQSASPYFVDFANHLKAPGYTLFGASVGYQSPGGRWQVYLDARNLTDEAYASSAGPIFDAGIGAAARNNRTFQAGDGVGITGGITLRF